MKHQVFIDQLYNELVDGVPEFLDQEDQIKKLLTEMLSIKDSFDPNPMFKKSLR